MENTPGKRLSVIDSEVSQKRARPIRSHDNNRGLIEFM